MTINVIAEKDCISCGETYAPTSSRQLVCFTCTPDKGWQARYRRYKVTKPQFDAQMEKQGWKCPLCLCPFPTTFETTIDHCHNSLIFRGILCRGCNMVVARFEDEEYVARVRTYLKGGLVTDAET